MLFANIKAVIDAECRKHPQCSQWLGDWSPEHETQILVDPTDLEPCHFDLSGKATQWLTPEGYRVANIRIPHDANTENPSFQDRLQIGPVHRYWKYIGTTGWNWKQKRSMWLGFDFDSIANHQGGLAPHLLEEVKQRAASLPYVVCRTSKSGKGIHLLVSLSPWIPTRTHTEHSELAKDVLARMGDDCDFAFLDAADVCGGILWHWERDLCNEGLQRIGYERMATASSCPARDN